MLHRERLNPPSYVYPADPWKIIEKRFYPRFLAQTETMFSISNGYIGLRGNFEEGAPAHEHGTFVNGFHETWPIIYGEEAFGFAKMGQTIVNVPDCKTIKLYVDDEPFFLPSADLVEYERTLDMQNGTLDREVLWETPAGKLVSIKSRRLTSFEHRHLAVIRYEVTVLNAKAPVVVSSELISRRSYREAKDDQRLAKAFIEQVLLPKAKYENDHRIIFGYRTRRSGMTLACGIDHMVETECNFSSKIRTTDDSGQIVYSFDALPAQPICITKFAAYHTSRSTPEKELCERTERTLDRGVAKGFTEILASQRQYLDDFWQRSDIEISIESPHARRSTEEWQQSIRFNLFHVFQAAARAEGTGIPAKGLTGQAYEGHYFWDIETYVLPFLIYTTPRVARNLLKFRHSMLDKARERARQVNQTGALFPWRTINGEEASAYYAAGTAQYHINADIIYALIKYVNATGDVDFLHREGAEMLVETARLWRDLGFFSERQGGRFCIHGVTGPDEYNTVVNNNTYTNLMARENMLCAAAVVRKLEADRPKLYVELVDKTGLKPSEVEEWQRAAENMFAPYDDEFGIHPQDDSFLDKKTWDFENTPPEKYPLLLHFHPLVIYRHKVIKQADLVLAMFLLGNEFSLEQKKRNFDYYDPLTTGDSSLSVGIQSIVAFELGYMDKALEYARYALLMDLADVGGNVSDGCHMAAMGNAWMILTYGFAGLRDYKGEISFNPKIPERIEKIRFHLTIREQLLEVDITGRSATYTLKRGEGLSIRHQEERIHLAPEAPSAKRRLDPQPL